MTLLNSSAGRLAASPQHESGSGSGSTHASVGAPAGGAEKHEFNPLAPSFGLTFWSGITFVMLLIVLAKFAWKPITAKVEEREKRIRGDVDAAEKARVDADAALKRLQAELATAEAKARETVEAARVRAEQLGAELAARAKADAEAIVTKAKADITAEREQALADVKTHIVELALAVTREVVKRTASQEDHAAVAAELLPKFKTVA